MIELINDYIKKNYEVIDTFEKVFNHLKLDDITTDFGSLRIIDHLTHKEISYNEFEKEIASIFALDDTSILKDWYNSQIGVLLGELLTFLDTHHLVLKIDGWDIVNEQNEVLTTDKLVRKYEGRFNKSFIKVVKHKWFMDRVIDESEKIMNF